MGKRREKNFIKTDKTTGSTLALTAAIMGIGAVVILGNKSEEDKQNDILKNFGQSPKQDWSDMNISPHMIPELDTSRMTGPPLAFTPSGSVVVVGQNDIGTRKTLDQYAAISREEHFRKRWGVPATLTAKGVATAMKNNVRGIFDYLLPLEKAKFADDVTARRFTIACETLDDLDYFEVMIASLMLATFNPQDATGATLQIPEIRKIFEFFGYHRFLIAENTAPYKVNEVLTQVLPLSEQTMVAARRINAAGEDVLDTSIQRFIRNGWGWGIPTECIPYFREGFFNDSTFGPDENRATGSRLNQLTEQQQGQLKAAMLDGNTLLIERAMIRFSNTIMAMMAGASPEHISDMYGKIGTALAAFGVGVVTGATTGNIPAVIQGAAAAVKTAIEFFQKLGQAEDQNTQAQNIVTAHCNRVLEIMGYSYKDLLGYRLRLEANWSGFRLGKGRTTSRILRNFVLQRDGLWAGCGGVMFPQLAMFFRQVPFNVICYAGNKDNWGVGLRFAPWKIPNTEITTKMPIGWYPFRINHKDGIVEIIDYDEQKTMRIEEFDLGDKALKFTR